jgi:hypothetical protein
MLSVPTLIIDKEHAVGDNWRNRYHQLVLHDPVWFDHLPYIPFPETWPVFTPKDKLADWFEMYARTLDLNIWTSSEMESGSWDESSQRWTVEIKRHGSQSKSNPETRTLHPRHIILATGHSGKPHLPEIPGMDSFKGDVLKHSSAFEGAQRDGRGKGKRAVVVGACNSAHDICQDFVEQGYESVTMVQRSTTCVVSSKAASEVLLGAAFSESGPPIEDADLLVWGLPAEVVKAIHYDLTEQQVAMDAHLLQSLSKAGFGLDRGPDNCGLFIKYLQRGGGYYFEVGASQLIAEGKIRVEHGREVAEILPHGLRLQDGTVLEADEMVFATGYDNMRTQARELFGDGVADHIDDVWGFGEDGETRTLWQRTAHPGFWLHAGNLALCRYYSRVLALQIKAQLEGLSK